MRPYNAAASSFYKTLPKTLELIKKGHTIYIQYKGKPVAKMTALSKDEGIENISLDSDLSEEKEEVPSSSLKTNNSGLVETAREVGSKPRPTWMIEAEERAAAEAESGDGLDEAIAKIQGIKRH